MNDFSWVDGYMTEKLGVTKDFKVEWGWHRYMVGGKMFAAIMHPSEKYDPSYADKDLINLKCDPDFAEILRKEHDYILPGFYSDKRCWNSVLLNSDTQEELLKKMIDESYQLVFNKLTKKLQKEILSNNQLS